MYVTIPCSAALRETITKFYLLLMMFILNCLTGLLSSSGLGRGSACCEHDYLYQVWLSDEYEDAILED